MVVVIDEQFFANLGRMEEIPDRNDVSNCDIVWFVMGYDERTTPYTLKPAGKFLTTLERAVEGLTNGIPVSLPTFEARITEKLTAQALGVFSLEQPLEIPADE